MPEVPLLWRQLITFYLVSTLSLFLLDGLFTVILIERPPNNLLELAACIALAIFLRAALAEWVTVNITGVWSTIGSKYSYRSLALAALIYGAPLLTISEHLSKPLNAAFLALSMWLDKALPLTYVNTLVGVFLYVLILDFARLILFLTIKKKLASNHSSRFR